MEQDPFDDAFLSSNFTHFDKTPVNVAPIFVQKRNPPPGCSVTSHSLQISRITVLVEQVNALPANSDICDGNGDRIRKFFDHLATEEIRNSDHGLAVSHWRLGQIKLAYLLIRKIGGAKYQKAGACFKISVDIRGNTLHVGLSIREINVQVRILRKTRRTEQGQCYEDSF